MGIPASWLTSAWRRTQMGLQIAVPAMPTPNEEPIVLSPELHTRKMGGAGTRKGKSTTLLRDSQQQ